MERGGGHKERGSAVRIHPAWTATLGSPARQPGASACRAAVAPILRPQTPPERGGRWLASVVPTLIERVPGLPAGWVGEQAAPVVPPPRSGAAEPLRPLGWNRAQSPPPQLGSTGRGGARAADHGGHVGSAAALRQAPAPRHSPCGWGEGCSPPFPLCTSPREFAVGDAHP